MKKTKILLLHGWNWKNYPNHNKVNPWSNRTSFIDALNMSDFEVLTPALPGFGDSIIPTSPWSLDDYAKWLKGQVEKSNPDVILGYSFGSAVITRYLSLLLNGNTVPKTILVSPAISRRYVHKANFLSKASRLFKNIFPRVVEMIRHLYLVYVVKNPFYTEGGDFQRATYRNIVGIDLSDELRVLFLKGFDIHLIFGSNDTATPPENLLSQVDLARSKTFIIKNGGHDIANSHTDELVLTIKEILKL